MSAFAGGLAQQYTTLAMQNQVSPSSSFGQESGFSLSSAFGLDGMNSGQMAQLGMGLSIASTAMQIVGGLVNAKGARRFQRAQFQREIEYRKKMHEFQLSLMEENNRINTEATQRAYREIQEQIDQSAVSSAMEVAAINREGRKRRSTADVSAAERGVDGMTADMVRDEIERNEVQAVFNTRLEQQWRERNLDASKDAVYAQGEGRRLSMLPRPMTPMQIQPMPVGPNPIAQAMEGFGNALLIGRQFAGLDAIFGDQS